MPQARRRAGRARVSAAAALATSVLGLLAFGDEDASGRVAPRLVILISLDTLRADRLDLYGYSRETAPALRRLAADGVAFRTTLAQNAQTLISHKSMFTGRYPLRLVREQTGLGVEGLERVDQPDLWLADALAASDGGLAEALRSRGYHSAAFTDGGWMTREHGFDEGFEVFDDRGGGFAAVLKRAVAWLSQLGTRRGFLFLHTYDIHCPYSSRAPFDTRFCADHEAHIPLAGLCPKPQLQSMALRDVDRRAISDHYDGGIAATDAHLGAFLGALRRAGLYDEALVVVTSDHGEGLFEHQSIGHGGLYLEQLLVPLIIKPPASWGIEPGMREQPAELVDLAPTLLEATGVEHHDGDGHSLLPAILGRERAVEPLIAQITFREGAKRETRPTKRALLEPGRWFVIHERGSGAAELYDLSVDPSCQDDIADERPDARDRTVQALSEHDPSGSNSADAVPPRELSERVRQELEALGYLEQESEAPEPSRSPRPELPD